MEFSLGYIKSENQILLKKFPEDHSSKGKIIARDLFQDLNLQAVFYDTKILGTESWIALLKEENKFFPLIHIKNEDDLSIEEFANIESSQALNTVLATQRSWAIKNNINLLENIFNMAKHLKGLWPNDRIAFFEELWFLMRSNLAATDMTIIFNNLKKGEKEGDKNKLIQMKIHGKKIPTSAEGGELEGKLMKNYTHHFSDTFEIIEWNRQKGELVATASIQKSPILMMVKLLHLTALQKSLFVSLFDGLQI